jgi:hypothetical protein
MANCKATFVGGKIGQKVVIDRPIGPIKQAVMDPPRRINWSLIIQKVTKQDFLLDALSLKCWFIMYHRPKII